MLAFALTAPLATHIAAQESSPTTLSAHERVYDAIDGGADRKVLHDRLVEAIKQTFAKEATFQALEAQSPGLINDIGDAIRPVLIRYSERVRLEYRPRMVAVIASAVNEQEAIQLAEFYESDIGRRLILGVSENYSASNVLDNATLDSPVTAEQVEADTRATTNAALADLSDAERQELIETAIRNPAFVKLRQIGPQMAALRAEMEEAPMTGSEEKQMEAAMGAVLSKRFPDL